MLVKDKTIEFVRNLFSKEHVRIYIWCVGAVIIWRLVLEITNHTIIKFIAATYQSMPGIEFGFDRWLSWDGKWYYSIFERGYTFDPTVQGQSNVAFFPGFPLLTDLLSSITTVDLVYSGLILNVILTTFSAFFIYRTTVILAAKYNLSQKRSQLSGQVSVLLFLVFPSSLFLAAYYAESLLIFGVSGAIYYALRNRMLVAALFAAVASSSKILGVAVAPTIIALHFFANYPGSGSFYRYVIHWLPRYIIYGLLAVSGLLLYMMFLYISFGDPLVFTKVQTHWDRQISGNFVITVWEAYYRHILSPSYFAGVFNYIVALQAMVLPIVAIGVGMYIAVKHRLYWLLLLVSILVLLPLSTSTLISMNRYIYAAVPFFSLAAIGILKSKLHADLILTAIVSFSYVTLLYMTSGFLSASYFAG